MRPVLPVLALTALAALAPLGAAQSEDDGCTHASPCVWIIEVDADGFLFYLPAEYNYTVGDWYTLDVYNEDADHAHTIALTGHDVSVTVPADGFTGMSDDEPEPFQLTKVGDFRLTDSPSGDELAVHVLEDDAVGQETGSGSSTGTETKGAPGVPFALVAVGLVAVAAAARRKA